jgi:hypothetical protein
MSSAVYPSWIVLGFAAINAVLLLLVLLSNRIIQHNQPPRAPISYDPAAPHKLDATDVLGWEFQYAGSTAGQAMGDRHTMVNFYLLAVGLSLSGVLAVFSGDAHLPRSAGTLLLWLVCGVGWIYFLSIVRLRQAWQDSARAMNQIKDFYVEHSRDFEPAELRKAFRWTSHTLPPADKPWTVFFYSAMLIGLLNSLAFLGGALLLAPQNQPATTIGLPPNFPWLLLLAVGYFAFHAWLYFAFLREGK